MCILSIKSKFVATGALTLLLTNPLFAETIDADGFKVDVISPKSSSAKIVKVRVDEKDGKLYIEGEITRKLRQQFVTLGHIDVAVEDANGNVISEATGNYWPKRVNKDINKPSHFSVELPSVPPQGSVIKIVRHLDEADHQYSPEHEENIAK